MSTEGSPTSYKAYNKTVEECLDFIRGNETMAQVFFCFDWIIEYPGLEEDKRVKFSRFVIFENLELFKDFCYDYKERKFKLNNDFIIGELNSYKSQLIAKKDSLALFYDFFLSCDYKTRQYIEILFQRTLFPLKGLLTLPQEFLFNKSEIENLIKFKVSNPVPWGRYPEYQTHRGIKYNNYGCFIIKLTRLCNLRCTYCHDWKEGPNNRLRIEDAIEILHKIFVYGKFKAVEFVWHGGEPTLFGIKNFYKILYAISFLKSEDHQIIQTLQTNGLSLPKAWIQIFKIFQISIGVSIDGPDKLQNINRPDINGKPTFERVQRSLAKLQKHGLANNVILVGNDQVMSLKPSDLFSFLSSVSVSNCCILPLLPGNCPKNNNFNYAEYRYKYFQFLLRLHEYRQKEKITIGIRELDTIIKAKNLKNPQHCELLGNCIGNFFSIDPDGSVHHCDKYINDPNYKLGNLLEGDDFKGIMTGEKIKKIRKENYRSLASLKNCKHFEVCQGWCPHERYLNFLYEESSSNCCGLSNLFDQI